MDFLYPARDASFYSPCQDKKDKKAEATESEQRTEQEAEKEEEEKGTATRATTRSASRLEAQRSLKESSTPRLNCHLKSSAHLDTKLRQLFLLICKNFKESSGFNPKTTESSRSESAERR